MIARAAFALALAGVLAAAPGWAQNASGTPGLNRHLGGDNSTSGTSEGGSGKSEGGISKSESGAGTSESGTARSGKSGNELPKALAEKLNGGKSGKDKHRGKAAHIVKPRANTAASAPPDVGKFMKSEEEAPSSEH